MRGCASTARFGSFFVVTMTVSFFSSSGRTFVTSSVSCAFGNVRESGSFSRNSPVVSTSASGRSTPAQRTTPIETTSSMAGSFSMRSTKPPPGASSTTARGRTGSPETCTGAPSKNTSAPLESARNICGDVAGRDDLARRRADDAIDGEILVRRLEARGSPALREARRERRAELLLAAAREDDEALEGETPLLLREAIDEPEARVVVGRRAGALGDVTCVRARSRPRRRAGKGRSCRRSRTTTPRPRGRA